MALARLSELLSRHLRGMFERLVLPRRLREVLDQLLTDAPPPSAGTDAFAGTATPTVPLHVGGFLELTLDPAAPPVPFRARRLGSPTAPLGFELDLTPPLSLFHLPAACRGATVAGTAAAPRLVPTPGAGPVALLAGGGAVLAVRIVATLDGEAWMDVVQAGGGAGEGNVRTTPPAVLLGPQGFGLHLVNGITFRATASPAATTPASTDAPATPPAERAVHVRAELFLPPATPWIGVGPIAVEFTLSSAHGLRGNVSATVPAVTAAPSRPEFRVAVAWNEPEARSLADALPTSIEITATWDLDRLSVPSGGSVAVAGERPIGLTGRFTRRPGTSELEFGLVLAADGPEGLFAVNADDTPGKIVVSAAALATAFIADARASDPAHQPLFEKNGATLAALLAAAALLPAYVKEGSVTVHAIGVELGTSGAGEKLALRVDYTVVAAVEDIDLGFLVLRMKPNAAMRVRYRNVRLLVDFARSDLERFQLSFAEAQVGVEDPGTWTMEPEVGVGDLFDVVGMRSGHGSTWYEVDLRFALDLGPVEVTGATVRVTLAAGGGFKPELRGLEARLSVPGVLEAEGKASFGAGRLDLALAARIVPLNIAALLSLTYAPCEGGDLLAFTLGVDLPGPIPLANSGLGLYGLGGVFGVNARLPAPRAGEDPVREQLGLNPLEASEYTCGPKSRVMGLAAVIGTAPDLGFAFSGRAVCVVQLPDLALRASLDAKVLSAPRASITARPCAGGPGACLLGVVSIAPDGITIAMRAGYKIPVLLTMEAPFGAWFPKRDAATWYARLGSDDVLARGPGPVRVRLLPGLFDIGASAYLMLAGDGIPSLGGDPLLAPTGFSIGLGARFNAKYGVPLVYAEVEASIHLALGTRPLLLGGAGRLAGSLHLGPVSVGVSAHLHVLVAPELGDLWMQLKLCGEVDLLFFTLADCVEIEVGTRAQALPEPTDWPLASIALADHLYTRFADAVLSWDRPALTAIPTVWPDVIPILQFTNGPANRLGEGGIDRGPFDARLAWNPAEVGDGVVGNDRLSSTYGLRAVRLLRLDPNGLTPVPGPLDAAWQAPKGSADAGRGARELALLTWETTLWTRKLLDGALGDPNDPIPAVAERCRTRSYAEAGWALGSLAHRSGPGREWRVPTEPSPGPLGSTFHLRVLPTWNGVLIDEHTLGALADQHTLRLPGPVGFDHAVEAAGRTFAGALELPCVVGLPADVPYAALGTLGEFRMSVVLTFSEPAEDCVLVLARPPGSPDMAPTRIDVALVKGGTPVRPTGRVKTLADGTVLITYGSDGGPFHRIEIQYSTALRVRLLGVQGSSETAKGRARAATDATWQAAATAKKKAETGAPRDLLAAATVYAIEADLVGQSQRDGEPGPVVERTERFWFQTARMPRTPASTGTQYLSGEPPLKARAHYDAFIASPTVHRRVHEFDPSYLERYVLGWTPANATERWFPSDPVGVQLAVHHVKQLAGIYGCDVAVRVRRIDPPPTPLGEAPVTPLLVHAVSSSAVSLALPRSDLRLYELTSAPGACRHPSPGVTLGGTPGLALSARYDLALAFPRRTASGTPPPPDVDAAELRGPLFSTSRYADPISLFVDLGFAAGPGGGTAVSGDLEVSATDLTTTVLMPRVLASDAALEHALVRLGLGRRRPAACGRSSALWTREDAAWRLRGVLLESPEPIHREDDLGLVGFSGRLRVGQLLCGAQAFEHVLRSSSGDRLLFLTRRRIPTPAPLTLTVNVQEIPFATATTARPLTLTSAVGGAPRFAQDLP